MKPTPTTSTNPFVLDEIIPHLRKARISNRNGVRTVVACCPAHDDTNPSLSITETADGKLLWHCHAGCSQEAVQQALERLAGVNRATVKVIPPRKQSATAKPTAPAQPLTLAQLANAKRLSAVKLFTWNVRTQSDGTIAIPYLTRDGVVSAIQYRYALAGDNRFKWRKHDIPILYGLWRLNEWITEHTLYLCEGTTDTWSMWHAGLPAIGIPSASTWREEWWRELDGFPQLVLIPDTDKAGAELVQKLAITCPEQYRERVYVLQLPDGVKDVNELWQRENAEPERFKQVLDGCEILAIWQYHKELPDCQIARNDTADDEEDEPLFLPLSELLAKSPARELEYLPLLGTDGLIARGAITLIGAHPKAGKTTLLVHACREWVQQNLRVVYLTEDSRIIWEERVKRFPELNQLILNKFTRAHPERWVRAIRELEPDVLVVDTIRRFVPAKDENDSASVSVALAPLVELQHHLPRTAIVLVHHTKKNLSMDGEITDIAGSHAYTAEVDAIFLLAPVRENKFQRILTPVAGRFWNFTPEPLVLELSESGTEYRVMGTVAEVLPLTRAESVKEKVLNAIQVLGSATRTEIEEYLEGMGEKIPERTIRDALLKLYEDGKVEREGKGTRGEPHIYRVPNSGNLAIWQSLNTLPDCQNSTQHTSTSDGEPNLFAVAPETPNENSGNRATT
jgi:hypothetical protein